MKLIKKLNAIQRDSEYSKMIEYLTLISDESSRCGKIVKDLLLFSHEEKDVFAKENLSTIIDKSITLSITSKFKKYLSRRSIRKKM